MDRIVGFKDIRDDEFWVAGHIPGRPLFPGVLMIETAAQLASFYTKKFVGWKGFVGFGAVENCRFRAQVSSRPAIDYPLPENLGAPPPNLMPHARPGERATRL